MQEFENNWKKINIAVVGQLINPILRKEPGIFSKSAAH